MIQSLPWKRVLFCNESDSIKSFGIHLTICEGNTEGAVDVVTVGVNNLVAYNVTEGTVKGTIEGTTIGTVVGAPVGTIVAVNKIRLQNLI